MNKTKQKLGEIRKDTLRYLDNGKSLTNSAPNTRTNEERENDAEERNYTSEIEALTYIDYWSVDAPLPYAIF
jgi:hypothetical protein